MWKLECRVQNYEWGKRGPSSHVGRLYTLMSSSSIHGAPALDLDLDNVPFAELWMGTHDSAPSLLLLPSPQPQPTEDGEHSLNVEEDVQNKIELKKWLQMHPQALGHTVIQKWGLDLPFLFKVLSVGKALSIQAHPDKNLAVLLHQSQPNIYKDSNHKPEMALALTEFEALCGFVSVQELKEVTQTVHEIKFILGETEAQELSDIHFENGNKEHTIKPLRSAFTKLMTMSKEAVAEILLNLKERLTEECKSRTLTEKEILVLRLEKQYPGDVGVLSAFFFNYIKLAPGEALYLDANEPHAYLYGECVECMATSDNVVRAGLTPKYRDVETLCSMLSYKQGLPEVLTGQHLNEFITRYSPPFDEFEVDRCILPPGASVTFHSTPGPSIYLALYGDGVATQRHQSEISISSIQEGNVFFVPAETELEISSSVKENEDVLDLSKTLQIYRAGVNSKVL